jgi:hypothetical protein
MKKVFFLVFLSLPTVYAMDISEVSPSISRDAVIARLDGDQALVQVYDDTTAINSKIVSDFLSRYGMHPTAENIASLMKFSRDSPVKFPAHDYLVNPAIGQKIKIVLIEKSLNSGIYGFLHFYDEAIEHRIEALDEAGREEVVALFGDDQSLVQIYDDVKALDSNMIKMLLNRYHMQPSANTVARLIEFARSNKVMTFPAHSFLSNPSIAINAKIMIVERALYHSMKEFLKFLN